MADNGGPRRITSPTTRFRLIRSHYENPHYTDVRNGSVVVAPSGSGRPEDYPPSVTVGCAAPTAVVRTNELRRVWRDQANPLWVAGMASSDWIFHGPLGDEMWIDELYEQIDWTLDATEAGHPTGSLTQRWRPLRYAWNEPRRPGDFIERVPEPGRNATPEEIREYRLEAEDRLARGINYEPFLSPVSSPINRTPEPYTDTAAGPWDAYRSEIEWLTRTFAQPQYAGTTGIPDAATSIPEVLRDYLVGVCTVWNRINRESNVIRELHNSLPGRQVYELQPPRFVKLIINETKYISGGSGGGGGGGAGATTFTYNPNTGQLETQQAPTAVL
jgi:hypothetical protein